MKELAGKAHRLPRTAGRAAGFTQQADPVAGLGFQPPDHVEFIGARAGHAGGGEAGALLARLGPERFDQAGGLGGKAVRKRRRGAGDGGLHGDARPQVHGGRLREDPFGRRRRGWSNRRRGWSRGLRRLAGCQDSNGDDRGAIDVRARGP